MHIVLKHPSGLRKTVKQGFSWTMLFFGVLVPLFRGDLKWFLMSCILAICTCGLSWLILPFIYNKMYLEDLLVKGWTIVE